VSNDFEPVPINDGNLTYSLVVGGCSDGSAVNGAIADFAIYNETARARGVDLLHALLRNIILCCWR
jgi:hypothetical protein